MDTYIIENIEDFNKYIHIFIEDARLKDSNIFICGFDAEYISNANSVNYNNSLNWIKQYYCDTATCLIQLASKNICVIINMVKMNGVMPNKLIKIIKNDCWMKFGVGIERDLQIISGNYDLGHCGGAIELKNIALLSQIKNPNLQNLCNLVLGANISKNESICDWANELIESEYEYAAKDAIISYQLGIKILEPTINFLNNTFNTKFIKINYVNKNFNIIKNITTNEIYENYVNKLQEYAQQNKYDMPTYNFDQNKINGDFLVSCSFNSTITQGHGKSKKSAKQESTKNMLLQLNI